MPGEEAWAGTVLVERRNAAAGVGGLPVVAARGRARVHREASATVDARASCYSVPGEVSMSGEPANRRTSRSRLQHVRARTLTVLVLLVIALAIVGFTQGWFASDWLKVVAIIGIILGVGGILRSFFDREARGEIVNLIAVAVALIPLIASTQNLTPGPSASESPAPELPLLPVKGLLPYLVSGTGQLGLLVRTCPLGNCGCSEPDCNLLGTAGENSQVWVECSRDSGYMPPGEPDSIWYKIRWPNSLGGTRAFFNSNPDSPYSGWIFSRYAVAAGPNGTPSSC